MARFRTVDPALRSTPTLDGVSVLARLVLIHLISEADDEGRLYGDPISIRTACFPRGLPPEVTEAMLEEVVGELEHARTRMIVRYEVGGQMYVAICGWSDGTSVTYQVIDRPTPSRMPAPPEGTCIVNRVGRGRRTPAVGKDDDSPSARRGLDEDSRRKGVDGDGTRTRSGRGRGPDPTGSRGPEPSPAGAGSGPRPECHASPAPDGPAPNAGAVAARVAVAQLSLPEHHPLQGDAQELMNVPGSDRRADWVARAERWLEDAVHATSRGGAK